MGEHEAQSGLDYLRELQSEGNYWGSMAVPRIEKRLEAGEDLADIMRDVLNEGARWLGLSAGPGGESRATEFSGANRQSLRQLFEVMGQTPRDYGYSSVVS